MIEWVSAPLLECEWGRFFIQSCMYIVLSVLDCIERTATVTLFLCCLLGSVSLLYGQTLCELICAVALLSPS